MIGVTQFDEHSRVTPTDALKTLFDGKLPAVFFYTK